MTTHSTCGVAQGSVRPKDDQHFWNFIFSLIFALLLTGSIWYLYKIYGGTPWAISLADFALISLAIFRITRLVVYDRITQFLRDMFLKSQELLGDDGILYIERTPYRGGPLRTISDLLSCPWCTGMWASLVVVFCYYTIPFAWYVLLVLAIAGVGNALQLIANMIGWRAENLKLDADR